VQYSSNINFYLHGNKAGKQRQVLLVSQPETKESIFSFSATTSNSNSNIDNLEINNSHQKKDRLTSSSNKRGARIPLNSDEIKSNTSSSNNIDKGTSLQ